MNSKLAYIIPTHSKTDTLVKALDSIFKQKEKAKVIVVGPKEVLESIDNDRSKLCVKVEENENTTYPNLVNKGIDAAKEDNEIEWVSILEHDDELLHHATELFIEYRDCYTNAEMFAGLTLLVEPSENDNPPTLKGMTNDACWAANLMETTGEFDFNALLRMGFVFLNSTFIKLSVFDTVGKLKNNFKLYSDYEFTLRAVYNGIIIRGIPKATHYHFVNGEYHKMLEKMDRDEVEFWANAARSSGKFKKEKKEKERLLDN